MYKVYLAGPDVFLPNAREIGENKKRICKEYGFEGLYPLDNELDINSYKSPKEFADAIFLGNLKYIQEADFGIFNLTPFRGPSADVGTVFELGMFAGMKKLVLGYSPHIGTETEQYIERVRKQYHLTRDDNCYRDNHMNSVEDFGNVDNLMIDGLFRTIKAPIMSTFLDCISFAANNLDDIKINRGAK